MTTLLQKMQKAKTNLPGCFAFILSMLSVLFERHCKRLPYLVIVLSSISSDFFKKFLFFVVIVVLLLFFHRFVAMLVIFTQESRL